MEKVSEKAPFVYLIFLLIAYLFTGVLLLLLAFALYRFQIGSGAVRAGIAMIYVAATFLAGFLAGKKAKSKKFLWGMGMGGGYFLLLAAISFAAGSGMGSMGGLAALLLCCAGGMLGGMVS